MGLGILAEPCVALCLVSGCRWMLLLLFAVVSVPISVSVSVAVVVATTCCLQCLVTIVFQQFFSSFVQFAACKRHAHAWIHRYICISPWCSLVTGGVLNTHTHILHTNYVLFALGCRFTPPNITTPPPCGRTAFNYSCVTFQFCYINTINGKMERFQVHRFNW